MFKWAKIISIVVALMAIGFAQTADTSSQQTVSSPNIVPASPIAGTILPSISEKKSITGVTPKPPTSWSKIKDLFL